MEVLPFTPENLAHALSNTLTTADIIPNKRQYHYYLNYLGEHGLSAKTIVIEENYISKDFLHDHATYYVLCFQDYKKVCKRVHFFAEAFDEQTLNANLLTSEEIPFWESYLGFTVVRPIPYTVIGYTVLRTYTEADADGQRNYWGLRKYKVHFFGRELVLKSLAFQEQDSVLAACATSAIWFTLNKASIDFSTILKVPSEITKDAAKLQTDGNRLFPNKGLTLPQISQAIHISGLAPEVRTATEEKKDALGDDTLYVKSEFVRKIVNAYAPIGIPIIMGIKVPMYDNSTGNSFYGFHAVSILGHKVGSENAPFAWKSDNITKLYIHDDQHGPFARVRFLEDGELQTPWTDIHPEQLPSYITSLVIPVYPKIRITYEDIESLVIGVYYILIAAFGENLEQQWDIQIKYSEDYKKEILVSSLEDADKLSIISSSMPKYIWISTLYSGENKVMEIIFDATGVKNAMIGLRLNTFLDEDVKAYIKEFIVNHTDDLKSLFGASGIKYIDFLIDNL
ncbi:hypothetical protein [Pedobacter chinensis]|uniref:hypothetical protein n=1 Tax=Pedobacter chinensis TaxID=2282421 RepID=UPI000E1BC01B|nr:hypothetical protein [Pedobacter chinensis]